MGGLFSSSHPPSPPARTSQPIWTNSSSNYHYSAPVTRPTSPTYVNRSVRSPSYAPHSTTSTSTYSRVSRIKLSSAVLRKPLAVNWDVHHSNEIIKYANVPPCSRDYLYVNEVFSNTCKGKNFEIQGIKRVQNPYLLGCYMLKKEEMISRHGSVEEEHVFHGTSEKNIINISKHNFNWRVIKEHLFGQGVSFSPISYYASHYSDENAHLKTMFLVRILVANSTEGRRNMTIPPEIMYSNERFDTTSNKEGKVIVKYSDNEFYPEFIIYYTGDTLPRVRKGNPNVNSHRGARKHSSNPGGRGPARKYDPDVYWLSYDYD